MGPGSLVVLLADPINRGVGWIVTIGRTGKLLVDWPADPDPETADRVRTWHDPFDLERFESWMPELTPADMIELGALPPREQAA